MQQFTYSRHEQPQDAVTAHAADAHLLAVGTT
jgi:hypothetical protein